jgi:TRAP-type mannitol/chloroaromatic compound transport system permease small subunit
MNSHPQESGGRPVDLVLRIAAHAVVAIGLVYTFNNYFNFWRGWPGVDGLFGQLGWFGVEAPATALEGGALALGWIQLGFYLGPLAAVVAVVLTTRDRPLRTDAESLVALAAYIARAAYWAVLLVGLADMVISFLRVEGLLPAVVGEALAKDLGRSSFRGEYVHYPLMGVSLVIAYFTRSLGFIWLAFLIVLAEFQIVISRFVFSYEQAFMGDLVRFWYGALFLFASAYTLIEEGHVRVDILYAGFTERGKAWTNFAGSLLLGVPLCWVILTRGIGGRSNLVNAPLLSYEVTQSGFGMYVKYLMAGFLLIYGLTMLVVFVSQFLSSAAVLLRDPAPEQARGNDQTA